jgi:hypothetical protein
MRRREFIVAERAAVSLPRGAAGGDAGGGYLTAGSPEVNFVAAFRKGPVKWVTRKAETRNRISLRARPKSALPGTRVDLVRRRVAAIAAIPPSRACGQSCDVTFDRLHAGGEWSKPSCQESQQPGVISRGLTP